MGLHLNYELSLPATAAEKKVEALVMQLRERACELPFAAVTDVERLTQVELSEPPPLLAPLVMRLEHVAYFNGSSARETLYARLMGIGDDQIFERRGDTIFYRPVDVPTGTRSVAYAFSVGVGAGSEPASLGVLQIAPEGRDVSPWWWRCFCKTQYASVHGDENLVRCHTALVNLLDAARSLGFEVQVHDETGYWESRDSDQLLAAVHRMNQLIAHFAGSFADAARAAGHDSRGIQAEIFRHPDFERLETQPPDSAGH